MTTLHLGPRTSGNKSLISFRAGYGIAGYVGYIPSSESIAVPVKHGPSLRNLDSRLQMRAQPLAEKETALRPETVYENTIARSPKRTSASVSSTAVIATDLEAEQGEAKPISPHRFIAETMYRQSFCSGAHQKDALSAGSPTSPNRRRPAYLAGSTYCATYENTTEMMHGEGWLDQQKTGEVKQQSVPFQEINCQRPVVPTNYGQDFGHFGNGVSGQLPDAPESTSLQGTTRHLFEGSPKAFKRVPGYCGFLPTTGNKTTDLHASAEYQRQDTKNCRLFILKQYWLDTPGFSGFRPQAAVNLMHSESKGRIGTTSSFMNQYLSRPENIEALNQKRAQQEHFGSTQATKAFFSEGQSVDKSENGAKDAEAYFKLLRPYEGLPRISLPSATSESGYRFNTYSGKL